MQSRWTNQRCLLSGVAVLFYGGLASLCAFGIGWGLARAFENNQ